MKKAATEGSQPNPTFEGLGETTGMIKGPGKCRYREIPMVRTLHSYQEIK